MIAIFNIGGNYGSLLNAFEKLNLPAEVTDTLKASHRAVVLPGVGRADVAMARLKIMGLDKIIPNLKCPVLGICCGYHVLCRRSEEGAATGLGIFPYDVVRLPQTRFGWEHSIHYNAYFYFCHRFATLEPKSKGEQIIHSVQQNNFTGVQFHPEKSGRAGLEFLKNWVSNITA